MASKWHSQSCVFVTFRRWISIDQTIKGLCFCDFQRLNLNRSDHKGTEKHSMGVFCNGACDVSLFWGPFEAVDMRRIQIRDSCLNPFISFCCCDYMNSKEMSVYINWCSRVMENIQLYSNTSLFVFCCCFGVFGCCYFVVVFEGWGLCVANHKAWRKRTPVCKLNEIKQLVTCLLLCQWYAFLASVVQIMPLKGSTA